MRLLFHRSLLPLIVLSILFVPLFSGCPIITGPEGEGETAEGEVIEGETIEGETTEGEMTEGETAEGETSEGETLEGETAEGEDDEGEVSEGEEEGEEVDEVKLPLVEAVADFMNPSVSITNAVEDLEEAFWDLVLARSAEEALDTLDEALAAKLDSETSLLTYLSRTAAIPTHTTDPGIDIDWLWAKQDAAANTTVVFVNGSWETQEGALAALVQLGEALDGHNVVKVVKVWNPPGTAGGVEDVFGAQLFPEVDPGVFPEVAGAIDVLRQSASQGLTDVLDHLTQWSAVENYGWFGEDDTDDVTGYELRRVIHEEIALGRFVVLIAHSQGGLRARSAVEGLTEDDRKSTAVLEVGSSARSMPRPSIRVDVCDDGIPYLSGRVDSQTCYAYDGVCGRTYQVSDLPESLVGNRTEPFCFSAHSFTGSYMQGESKNAILAAVDDLRYGLMFPGNADAVLSINASEDTQTGEIEIGFTVSDEEGDANTFLLTWGEWTLGSDFDPTISGLTGGTAVERPDGSIWLEDVPPGDHSFIWDSRADLEPNHLYNTDRAWFTFTFWDTDAPGWTWSQDSGFIAVENGAPTAAFSADPISGFAPVTVQFADESERGRTSISAWLWDFGDGTGSDMQNPLHIYTEAGVYSVSLTVTSAAGSSTETKEEYVNVIDPGDGAIAGRTVDAQSGAAVQGASVTVRERGWYYAEHILASSDTDENGQFLVEELPLTDVELTYEKSGYLPTVQYATVLEDVTTQISAALMVLVTGVSTGSVSGTIINAVTGDGVDGASLVLCPGIRPLDDPADDVTATTDASQDGQYIFTDIDAGVYTVFASKEGFADASFTVFVVGGVESGGQDGTMSPNVAQGEVRIVLTWGATPHDLDSHLSGPADGGRFHVYFGNPVVTGHADLDLDDVTSYGPETITIHELRPGTYRYSVHDYTNLSSSTSTAMSNSSATVKLISEAGTREFNITPNTPATLWTVFEIDGSSGTITTVNSYSFVSMPDENTKQAEGEVVPGAEDPALFWDLPLK